MELLADAFAIFPINSIKHKTMSALWAEFIGTLLLLLIGNGVVANVVLKGTKAQGDPGSWIMIRPRGD